MPRASYDQATKDAFIKAAVDARVANKSWNEAHDAAKAAGYQGSMQGIVKLLRAIERRKGKTGRRPGRPVGSTNAARKNLELASVAGAPADIADLVNILVKKRINEALDQAIAVLQNAKV